MKQLVQLTIWEAVSFWLACIMVFNTVVYNGFTTGHRSSDGNLRLFLVATYALFQLLFSGYASYLHRKTYGCVVEQACWVVLTKLFVFANLLEHDWWLKQHLDWIGGETDLSNYDQERPEFDDNGNRIRYQDRGLILRRFRMVLLGEWHIAETLGSVFTDCNPQVETRTLVIPQDQQAEDMARDVSSLDNDGKAYFKNVQLGESAIEKTIKSTRESEMKNLEKALETGLEKTLVHVGILLGIILSTGIAPYTSVEFEKSSAVQLGSYALLLAVATGLTALLSSVTSIISAQESLELLARLQRHLIHNTDFDKHFEPYSNLRDIMLAAFGDGIRPPRNMSFTEILRNTNGLRRWGCIFFGRGLAFLPSKVQVRRGRQAHWSHPLRNRATGPIRFSTDGDILKYKKDAVIESVRFDFGDSFLDSTSDDDHRHHEGVQTEGSSEHPVRGNDEPHEIADIKPRKATSLKDFQNLQVVKTETTGRRSSF
ncbi:hypothetical protein PG999_010254 [Apiospora kogelbergensis]|uniref:SMODS and SLOG-associating 2TM effector domain-containing protein n=1 Tax=Apiospora kogelbergensis TaxID=1337665 RepID=A0AAW0Q9J5_9PEZI